MELPDPAAARSLYELVHALVTRQTYIQGEIAIAAGPYGNAAKKFGDHLDKLSRGEIDTAHRFIDQKSLAAAVEVARRLGVRVTFDLPARALTYAEREDFFARLTTAAGDEFERRSNAEAKRFTEWAKGQPGEPEQAVENIIGDKLRGKQAVLWELLGSNAGEYVDRETIARVVYENQGEPAPTTEAVRKLKGRMVDEVKNAGYHVEVIGNRKGGWMLRPGVYRHNPVKPTESQKPSTSNNR